MDPVSRTEMNTACGDGDVRGSPEYAVSVAVVSIFLSGLLILVLKFIAEPSDPLVQTLLRT